MMPECMSLYVRTCQRVRNSKNIATIRDFQVYIRVNSTINYEPNFTEKFLRESGFPIFGRKFFVSRWKLVFWPPFVIVYPIFDFFAVFWFFWITLSVAPISPPNSFGKVLFWVRVHRDPPLTTNWSTLYLHHLSVKQTNMLKKWLLAVDLWLSAGQLKHTLGFPAHVWLPRANEKPKFRTLAFIHYKKKPFLLRF